MTAELRFLTSDDRHAVVSSQRGLDDRDHRALLDSDWGRRHARVAVLVDDDARVLASLLVHELAYRLDFRRLRLAGLGTPHVRECRRRRGLDRFFLKAVHDRLAGEGFDGAVCFAAPQARWPERLGYEPLPLATLVADTRGLELLAGTGASPSRIRPYDESDFEAVRNLYNTATCVQRLAVLRDDLTWERELLRARLLREGSPHALPLDFLVGECEGRVVSYLRAERPTASALTILEYGFEVGKREDVAALVRGVLAPLGDDAPRRLRSIAPTRLANLLPTRKLAWRCQAGPRMLMRSFGSFDVPTDSPPDERLVWQADWLAPAGAVSRLAA